MKNNKLDLYFTQHLKINVKQIEDLNMKGKTKKLIEHIQEYQVVD